MLAFEAKNDAHVALLVQWWSQMSPADKANTFHPSYHGLAPFLSYFIRGEANLMFALDGGGIWLAVWTSALYDAATFACWIRPEKRHTLSAWRELQQAYTAALQVYPSVVDITRQANLHAAHLKLGYEFRGKFTNVLSSGTVYLYELTRAGWAQRATAARAVRDRKREKRRPARVHRNGATPHATNGGEAITDEALEHQPWVQRQLAKLGIN